MFFAAISCIQVLVNSISDYAWAHGKLYAAGSSVSLYTAEGEEALKVDSYCPVTARLVCEGVDLTGLRWKYNEELIEIYSFTQGDTATSQPVALDDNPAFVAVQLTYISQCPTQNCVQANFSSVLTVDSSQLLEQDISSITCDDVSSSATTEIVAVTAISSDTLIITKVTASYVWGAPNRLIVNWEKLVSSYDLYTYYSHRASKLGAHYLHIILSKWYQEFLSHDHSNVTDSHLENSHTLHFI